MSTKTESLSQDDLLREFTEIARTEIGFNDQFAGQVAEAFLRGLSKRLRGKSIYVPSAPYISARNEAIRRENTGTNRIALCRKYGISLATFYNIINRR